ncbi:TPA: NUDIX domain-containing protein [Staphylococcus delphini]|uniref:NUDIX domain-containing protein n=1 Tax=Staphylococcus aureus TaxID=1280 RepID=UPI001654687E|nr:NUDIX domain-containing protein [Staphylococcus aureus]HEC2188842.1 NUDIX domain-containing protein [Staphylococcus delphini]HDK4771679.1 NUDIX domain-containing protein [Staphylococcus aureus]HDK4782615.1 NUDIX domain-containing protein [Staphylococcus aureus]HEC2195535.1 NUDIX domain-containing protein [Staphylococcus delphini]HEC2201104.1 NUDIX domain-containing protein [Staphylococcus delphini]
MIHYNCACLVNIEKKRIFLVRTYDNNKYYLPGGKIENQESFDEALIRELKEELSLRIKKSEVIFWKSIEGPAYPNTKETVLLNCFLFSGEAFDYKINNEITDANFFSIYDEDIMAPAVINVIKALEVDGYV